MTNTTFKFHLNTWQHLYSLQQALQQTLNFSGNRLIIAGVIRNEAFFSRRDMPVQLTFTEATAPQYKKNADNKFIFGQLHRGDELTGDIYIDARVFAEIKKNLVEYIGIDGIHMQITIGIDLTGADWQHKTSADITQLDYAMQGDGG